MSKYNSADSVLADDDVKNMVRDMAEKAGVSVVEISSELGIHRNTISKFLNGYHYHEYWEEVDPNRIKFDVNESKCVADEGLSLDDEDTRFLVRDMAKKESGNTLQDICRQTNISKNAVRAFLDRKTYMAFWDEHGTDEGFEEPVFDGTMEEPEYEDFSSKGHDRFIVTCAQNNTHINAEFMDTLESYSKLTNAKLLVSPILYHANGFLGAKQTTVAYDDRVEPYLVNDALKLSDYLGGLVFCAELNIIPTAVNPMSAMQTYCKSASGIFPHAKLQMESVPTHKSDPCRMLYTTGTVTQRHYSVNKAGQKAAFHHVFGALVVEIDNANECWYVRQVNAAADGSFQDLDKVYHPDGSVSDGEIEAINWGDIHSEKCDNEQIDLYYGKGGILDTLKPKYQFVHDLSDFAPRNHHNRKDPHFLFAVCNSDIQTVEEGLNVSADMLKVMSRDWCETVVVNSNHDNALEKWLKEADYRMDPVNALFFLTAQKECYEAIHSNDTNFSIFEKSLTDIISRPVDMAKNRIKFLRLDESFTICNNVSGGHIECGYHGHTGNNGARGSVTSYQKLGTKVNIGHSHSATIKDGVYQAGVTGSLDMGYNVGASSWSRSHIVTYGNGKRSIITTHGTNWKL